MRRRPQIDRRRGILRAAAVVAVLTIILVIGLLILSSATAVAPTPTPVAPTVPATPGPTAKPTVHTTPGKATPGVKRSRNQTAPTPRSTASHEYGPSTDVRIRAVTFARMSAPYLYFAGSGDAYRGRLLYLRKSSGQALLLGRADPYVRPVAVSGGRQIYFVRVASDRAFPGARWSLYEFDVTSRRTVMRASMLGMGMTPLGMSGGRFLFLVSRETDTSLFELSPSGSRFVSIVITQPVGFAELSPDGKYIGFASPASCVYCTLDTFDVPARTLWNGPSGLWGEENFAWTRDSTNIVAHIGKHITTIGIPGHETANYSTPKELAGQWPRSLQVSVAESMIAIVDPASGRHYLSQRQ